MKRCPKCGETKSLSEFHRNPARSSGVSPYCKPCQNRATSESNQRVRIRALWACGGMFCCRCGFDDPRALVLDHRNGGGAAHRAVASHSAIYRYAAEHPEEFQVLCANCNQIKRYEDGEWGGSTEYAIRVREMDWPVNKARWARLFDKCIECGTTETQHQGNGRCQNCFMRKRRREHRALSD
jgi:hypothetical protein